MKTIYLDYEKDGRVRVTVLSGVKGKRVHRFPERKPAERFADNLVGRGVIVSTLDMTPQQLVEFRKKFPLEEA